MDCNLIPLIYINPMVHMFFIPSIYFLFSYVFLLLRLRSQSFFFHLLPLMYHLYSLPPISTFRFQSHSNPSSLSLRTYTQGSVNNAARISARIHLLHGSAASKSPSWFTQGLRFHQNHCLRHSSTLHLPFCWTSVCSAAPPASPDLLLCSSSRKCLFSFIPSHVVSASGKVVSAQAVETSLSASCL